MIDTLKKFIWIAAAGWLILGVSGCGTASSQKSTVQIRAGHFSNITHAQGLIGHATDRFEKKLAPAATVEWTIFNAGPSAIEALFAGHIDVVYIGPSPAVNGYVKSGGEAVRVVAGSAIGGAALVVREDAGILVPADLRGKKVASPQLGNTQDVALRSWLAKQDLGLKEKGGDVQVLPIANADQQTLFLKKELDAAWAVEPWVSILTKTAGAKVFFEESTLWPDGKYATTVLLVRTQFLKDHPELVKKFVEVHVELTDWIRQNPSEAKKIVAEEIERETHKAIPADILEGAWSRIEFSYELPVFSIREQAKAAQAVGFLKELPDLEGLFSPSLLEEVLKEQASRA